MFGLVVMFITDIKIQDILHRDPPAGGCPVPASGYAYEITPPGSQTF